MNASSDHISEDRIKAVLDAIRPMIQRDNGDIEYVGLTPDNIVQIRFLGACIGCPSSSMTLRYGIEENLREHLPGIAGVEAVL